MGRIVVNDPLTGKIIRCCYDVHGVLGPGFKENAYHKALCKALKESHIAFDSEKVFSVKFKDEKVGTYKPDLFIENAVILEIKAISGLQPKLFEYQLLSYLKVANVRVGLLVNFGNKSCEVRRLVLPEWKLSPIKAP